VAFYLSVQPYFNSYLQVVHNQSIAAAGRITQVFSFASTATAVIISFFIKRTAHYKYFVVSGACIYTMAVGFMLRYRSEAASTGQLVVSQVALGIGGGMLITPSQLGVQASSSHQEVAGATAIFLTILETGGAVGAAVSGAVWTANLPTKLAAHLPKSIKGHAMDIFGNLEIARSYAVGTPERAAINKAYEETIRILLTIALCACVPLIPLSLMMRDYKLNKVKGYYLPMPPLLKDFLLTRPAIYLKMDSHVRGRVIGAAHHTQPNADGYGGCGSSSQATTDRSRA
jgi:hypothetical protein